MEDSLLNRLSDDRITSRQIDELVGLVRGILADKAVNLAEAEYLEKWLAANASVRTTPLFATLYSRIADMVCDGTLDAEEQIELMETLGSLTGRDFELGEALTSTTLPLTTPAPEITFPDMHFTFTGTFMFGQRKDCEAIVRDLGATAGSLTKKTDVLVIGAYATESWKHSSFGNKILKACKMNDQGTPVAIITEEHWFTSISKNEL